MLVALRGRRTQGCGIGPPAMSRVVEARYVDPLDHIWLSAAAELGLRVRRSPHGYATTDGKGELAIAPPEELDSDDCLAQIILHELCHALVQGEDSFQKPDWGLSNDSESAQYQGDTVAEQACLRLQATLLRPHGLRRLLAPTTDFRSFYDALPRDPLKSVAGDPAVLLAIRGLSLAARPPYRRVLQDALLATATVVSALCKATQRQKEGAVVYDAAAAQGVSPASAQLPSVWQLLPLGKRHKSGLPLSDGMHSAPPGATCGSCAYAQKPASDRRSATWRCQRTANDDRKGLVIDPEATGCSLYQASLDCQECGACCRHAYDIVEVSRSEPMVTRQPQLIERKGKQLRILRDPEKQRCAALSGPELGPFGCTVYHDRPATCRDFSSGTYRCQDARRRVGWEG